MKILVSNLCLFAADQQGVKENQRRYHVNIAAHYKVVAESHR